MAVAKGLTKGDLWSPFFSLLNPMVVISRQDYTEFMPLILRLAYVLMANIVVFLQLFAYIACCNAAS